MYEVEQEANQRVRCLLVVPKSVNPKELQNLVETLDMEVVEIVSLPDRNSSTNIVRFGIGSGKTQEIAQLAENLDADCIIFDTELIQVTQPKDKIDGNKSFITKEIPYPDINPTRQRNWEKLTSLPVFDRQEVILRIFAQRARTKEAALQVELALPIWAVERNFQSMLHYDDKIRRQL